MRTNKFKKFVSPFGWIGPLVATIMGIPFMMGGEFWRVTYGWWSLAIALHWVVIIYLMWLLYEKIDTFSDLPKVILFEQDIGSLITESRSWMGNGVGVSVYQCSRGVERLVAHGVVSNIQVDGKSQIQISPIDDAKSEDQFIGFVAAIPRDEFVIKPGQFLRII